MQKKSKTARIYNLGAGISQAIGRGTHDPCDALGADVGCNYYSGPGMTVNPTAWRVAQARGAEEIVAAKLNPGPLRYITTGGQSERVFDHLEGHNLRLLVEILCEARSRFGPGSELPPQSAESASICSL